MSSTTGGCSPAGRAMLIGEEPLTPRMVPARGLKRWEDTEIPTQSRAAAMREYLPAPPKWKWLRVVTAAAPCSRARSTAHSAPCLQGRWPMPPSPSRVCAVVDSRTTLMSGAGLTLPSRIMRQYPEVCQVPWLTTPRRSVSTSSSAMAAVNRAPRSCRRARTGFARAGAGRRRARGYRFQAGRYPLGDLLSVGQVMPPQGGGGPAGPGGSRSGEGFPALRRVVESS